MTKRVIFVLFSIFFLVSLSSNADEIPNVSIHLDQGFVDLDLKITKTSKTPDGAIYFVAQGKIKKQIVGFIFAIAPEWKKGEQAGDGFSPLWGYTQIQTIGEESDRFISELSTLYKIKNTGAKNMAKQINFPAVALAGNPVEALAKPVKFKLFFQGKSEADYAEVYLNIDPKNKKIEFHEKDPEYRQQLINGLRLGN
jgi:hypothetical protein